MAISAPFCKSPPVKNRPGGTTPGYNHFDAATIAAMPALTASGRDGHAPIIAASRRSLETILFTFLVTLAGGSAPEPCVYSRVLALFPVGSIIWIAKVADSASNTLMLEIQVHNQNHIPAGQQMQVTFLPPIAAAPMSDGHGLQTSSAEKGPVLPHGRRP